MSESQHAPDLDVVNQYSVSVSASDFLLTVGRMRPVFVDGSMTLAIEWLKTLALSPGSAKQLHLTLGRAVQEFEGRFGQIPQDPDAKVVAETANRS